MVHIAKKLVFLCMLIGCSQAFPYHDVTTEDKAIKMFEVERERQDAMQSVTDFTPPVCRVVNESLDCPLSCENASWEVTYIMSDGAGSGIDHPSLSVTDSTEFNNTFSISIDTTVDENGYNATIVEYIGSCCFHDVEITVTDKAGNKAKCPFNIKRPVVTTISPMTVKPTSSSSTTTISLLSSFIVMALKSILF
ncbi:uncharacterized protein si:ch211-113d11.6 [Megalobrama amblycephala]|uniref:uncharacterized protein si:ch211-113d11.6 n=1 Tax=Megalobrama amblycephala TaxID=75352 RepID=UPI0020143A23|nr:uncharacterized protein si:ch211-113d11.6 [Megalobrama amblycephala]XP_048032976.1 uncharacterized protein si:ch211-113d11.6 [Megalobrama amblycephala]